MRSVSSAPTLPFYLQILIWPVSKMHTPLALPSFLCPLGSSGWLCPSQHGPEQVVQPENCTHFWFCLSDTPSAQGEAAPRGACRQGWATGMPLVRPSTSQNVAQQSWDLGNSVGFWHPHPCISVTLTISTSAGGGKCSLPCFHCFTVLRSPYVLSAHTLPRLPAPWNVHLLFPWPTPVLLPGITSASPIPPHTQARHSCLPVLGALCTFFLPPFTGLSPPSAVTALQESVVPSGAPSSSQARTVSSLFL